MSAEKSDSVTAIASHQVQPARHVKSAQTQIEEARRQIADLRLCLTKSIQALDDWISTYAHEFCDPVDVMLARDRIADGGGTLAYVADITHEARLILARLDGEQQK